MFIQMAERLLDSVGGFFVMLLLARFYFQYLRVSLQNPLGGFVLALTDWFILPLRRVMPRWGRVDFASLIAAGVVHALCLVLLGLVSGASFSVFSWPALLMLSALDLLRSSVHLLVFALLLQAVLSWTQPFSPMATVLNALVGPLLRPIQRVIPLIGNIDLSPLVLLVLLQLLLIPLAHIRLLIAMSF